MTTGPLPRVGHQMIAQSNIFGHKNAVANLTVSWVRSWSGFRHSPGGRIALRRPECGYGIPNLPGSKPNDGG